LFLIVEHGSIDLLFYEIIWIQSMIQKEWVVALPSSPEHLHLYKDISPILAQILFNRGFETADDAHQFLYEKDLNDDPYIMKDMGKAVERISSAIKNHDPIVIFGDFDADGVTSTTLMVQVLKALGADVSPYIPDRVAEGYGLNTPALQSLAQQGKKLVITVDCGIRSVDDVIAGIETGLDIIITDHHSIGPEIPPALAVINPQQEDCNGNTKLAGVGVAFMLAQALLLHRRRHDRENYPAIRLSDLLDLVAIGTVADIMVLNNGMNRRMVAHGLNTINEMRRPGIRALAKVVDLTPGKITAMDIGFGLGPRINAAGRLKSAMVAYNLLSAQTDDEAMQYAVELQQLNIQRQKLTREAQAAISEQVADMDDVSLIFAGDERFQPGIVGLVAGRLAEEYYRPAVVLEIGEEQSRASCRSIPEFNITHALDECADLLVRHGGHAMAAGFTVDNANMDVLKQELQQRAKDALDGRNLVRTLHLDAEINVNHLTEALVKELKILEPTGHENRPASFISRDVRVLDCRTVGADDKHLKLKIARAGQEPLDAIGFGLGAWAKQMPSVIDIAFHLEMNEWRGRQSLQIRLLDVRPAEVGV
jgi:single-stranded-DNA-specific exonuclease